MNDQWVIRIVANRQHLVDCFDVFDVAFDGHTLRLLVTCPTQS